MDKKNVRGFLEFVYDFYKSMKAHEITLVYEGEITHQITKAFTSLTESNMAKEEESNTVQKKVFHVMVECLQNISKHADSFGSDDFLFAGRGIFMVSKGDIEYHVTTGLTPATPFAVSVVVALEQIGVAVAVAEVIAGAVAQFAGDKSVTTIESIESDVFLPAASPIYIFSKFRDGVIAIPFAINVDPDQTANESFPILEVPPEGSV